MQSTFQAQFPRGPVAIHAFGDLERVALAASGQGGNLAPETYAGAMHGFTMDDLPAYNPAAADRHLDRVSSLIREVLS